MVPVALDYAEVVDPDSPESKFLTPLLKQRQQTQCLWIFSPGGQVLGGFESSIPLHRFEKEISNGRSVGLVKNTQLQIDTALRIFGDVRPRAATTSDVGISRGVGYLANGNVCLAQYVRRRDSSNIQSPVIASVVLSKDQLGAFAPPVTERDQTWAVSDAVVKKLCRVLSPLGYERAPQEDWITEIRLTGQVDSIGDGFAHLKFSGHISSAEHGYIRGNIHSRQEVTLEGSGLYHLESGQIQSLQVVGSGMICWIREAPDHPVPFDVLIEWQNIDSRTRQVAVTRDQIPR